VAPAPPVPPAVTAILFPPTRALTVNDVLMASTRVPNFNAGMPSSVVNCLSDWRLMRLEAYIDLKGKSRLWGDGKAQAYAKRLYMMRLIRRSAPYVARDLPRPLTQDEKEERAAVQ
jgi:hypothetical protein